jgi:putative nucleotidyltransferase with HDIG domain
MTAPGERVAHGEPAAVLALAREALAAQDAWVVGGVIRDRLLGRTPPRADVDLVVDGDPGAAAQLVRERAGRGSAAFALSDAFGAWRLVGPGGAWQVDVAPLHEGGLEADLLARDLTINAIAEPLAGGALIDPANGAEDVRRRVLRMPAPSAFTADPLRILRVARLSVELGFDAEAGTRAAARDAAPALSAVSGERVFMELRGILAAPVPSQAFALLADLGATAVVLPELEALRGIQQTVYHHLDAHDHTLDVLDRVAALERSPADVVGAGRADAVAALLREPLADELTRGGALRWGALLHDIAKSRTQVELGEGAYGFPGHDREGAAMTRAILERLRASERLRAHVAALARHHLRAGFLVRERPLSRRVVHGYLVACDPVAADVTLLSIADRLATRGRKAEISIERHLEVALPLLDDALRWHSGGPPDPLVRGDALGAALGIRPGPRLGELLAEIAAAQYAGEIATADEAIAHARGLAERAAPER